MWPPAKTIAARTAPMASGASAEPDSTATMIVKTRKKVPMNSVAYLRMVFLWVSGWGSGGQKFEQAGGPEPGDELVVDEDRGHHPDALLEQLVQQGRLFGGVLLLVLDLLLGQQGLVLGAQRAAGGGVQHDVAHQGVSFQVDGQQAAARAGSNCAKVRPGVCSAVSTRSTSST